MDTFTIGAATGAATSLLTGLISFFVNTLKITAYNNVYIAGGLMAKRVLSAPVILPWLIIGWAGHLAIGAAFGWVLAYLLERTGFRLGVIKGFILGVLAWYFSHGIMVPLLGNALIPPLLPSDLSYSLAIHMLHGLVNAWLILYVIRLRAAKAV